MGRSTTKADNTKTTTLCVSIPLSPGGDSTCGCVDSVRAMTRIRIRCGRCLCKHTDSAVETTHTHTYRHSFFGKQCDSRKASPATATFGGDPRELPGFRSEVPSKVRALASCRPHGGVEMQAWHQNGSRAAAAPHPQDHYYTKHHATINLCKYSPGPKYGATSSLGEWSPPTRPPPACAACVW